MKTIDINGVSRTEIGKKEVHKLRATGMVPCVLYGSEKDKEGNPVATALSIPYESLRKIIYTPLIYVINLTIDGKKLVNAVIKEAQFHPVKDTILHMDFYQISEEKPIVVKVPVALEGLAAGVRSGGKLALVMRYLSVKAIYSDIPEKLTVDVKDLKLGKSIKVGDLKFNKLELVNPKSAVVCTVKTTRTATDTETTEEGEAATEGAAEGATPAAAEEKK